MSRKQRKASVRCEPIPAPKAGKPGVPPKSAASAVAEAFVLAVRQHQTGHVTEAEKLYRVVLKAQPRHPGALNHLGVIARQAGHLDTAITLILDAIHAQPTYAEAYINLSNALTDAGDYSRAMSACRTAAALCPDLAESYFLSGNLWGRQSRFSDASTRFRRALILRPDYAEAHNNLGNSLRLSGRFEEAAACYRRVLQLHPGFGEIYANLSGMVREMGRYDKAITYCRRALIIQPRSAQACNNLGIALLERGYGEDARKTFISALQLRLDLAEAHANLGNALRSLGRLRDATASYRRAAVLDPSYAEVYGNLGLILQEQCRQAEAEALYRRALRIRPDNRDLHSNLIFALDFNPACDTAIQQAERRRWNDQHARPLPAVARPAFTSLRNAGRRLRVGYVSADFRLHSAAFAFGAVLRHHDHSQFEVYCYSSTAVEDGVTAGLRQAADAWFPVRSLTDERLAERIAEDRIDVLVDLSGHSAGNRLLSFARRPAPVQVSAWGNVTGTGLEAMDYLLADPMTVPEDERPLLAERVYDLPCLLTYEAPSYVPDVAPSPFVAARGAITFGCFNRLAKVSAEVLAVWAQILRDVPRSRLILKDRALDEPEQRRRVFDTLAGFGIDIQRIAVLGTTPHNRHMAAYAHVDIALDPFPQNGGISTCEALWMGVPVVSLRGRTLPGRVSASILSTCGLGDWVAQTTDDYAVIAVRAASRPAMLERTRTQMRARLMACPVGNPKTYTQAVEAGYRQMWQHWCSS